MSLTEAMLMTIREDGAGYVSEAESQGLRSFVLVLLTIAGLVLVLLGVAGAGV